MAASRIHLSLLSLCLVLSALCALSAATQQQQPNKAESKLIGCQACEEAAKHFYRQVEKLRKKRGKLSEAEISEIGENVCNPMTDEGEWITSYDLLVRQDKLVMEEQQYLGICQEECFTIAQACEDAFAEHVLDAGELLWKGDMKRAKFTKEVCRKISDACESPAPKLTKARRDEEFLAANSEDRQMEKLMSQMRAQGLKGNMYDREEIEKFSKSMQEKEMQQQQQESQSIYGLPSGGYTAPRFEYIPVSLRGLAEVVYNVGYSFWEWGSEIFGVEKTK